MQQSVELPKPGRFKNADRKGSSVKNFAKMMVNDHTKAGAELDALANKK